MIADALTKVDSPLVGILEAFMTATKATYANIKPRQQPEVLAAARPAQ